MNRRGIKFVLIAVLVLAFATLACGPVGTETPEPTDPPPPTDVPPEPTDPPPPTTPPEPTAPPPTEPPPPTAQPQPSGDVLFQDDFSDPNSGWEEVEFENGEVGYRDGYYFAETDLEAGMVWGTANQSFSDLVLEVDATQVAAPANDKNGYGIMCRIQPNDAGYLMRISGDGYYAIHRIDEGEFVTLVDWTSSPAINQGNATNRIRAVCDGPIIALFVNGEFLAETTDTTYTSGDIGLAATTFEENQRTEIHFDDVVVRAGREGGEARPEPPPTEGVLLQDDFSDPNSGWEVGEYEDGSVGYGDGYYFVTATRDDGAMWGVAYQDFTDMVIEVDATQVEAPANDNNAYGVKCRVQVEEGTGGDGYAMMISGDGYYSIQEITGGSYESLVDWTTSPVINQGDATNRIRAVCVGDRLALYVNGELLAETTDDTYTSGDISLMAATLEPEATEIHFDNLVVRGPQGSGAQQPPPPAGGDVVFQDDFSDPNSGWEVGDYDEGSEGYVDGSYFVRGEEDGTIVWGVASQAFDDFVLDVDTTQVEAPANDNNGYGVIARVQPGPAGDGYAFYISGDGYYTIQKITGGDYEPLVNWASSPAINQGNATNHLHIVCDGPNLSFTVNGQFLAETTDTTYTSGDLALAAGTLEAEPTEIHFDNVVVTEP